MNVGSLFSGIGGIDLGLERAGMRVLWQVESDPYARAVLRKHWPAAAIYNDVREVGAANLAPVDLICGGFPCQPFSSASRGRKRGTADARWLWPEMHRVIGELEPAWVFAENVTHIDGPALEQVAADLGGSGYEVGTLEVPACAFGHDHRRARLWILGHANRDGQPSRAVDAEASRLSWARGEPRGVDEANGIPRRVALRLLGNAVVPQVAEWIGRQIMRHAEGS